MVWGPVLGAGLLGLSNYATNRANRKAAERQEQERAARVGEARAGQADLDKKIWSPKQQELSGFITRGAGAAAKQGQTYSDLLSNWPDTATTRTPFGTTLSSIQADEAGKRAAREAGIYKPAQDLAAASDIRRYGSSSNRGSPSGPLGKTLAALRQQDLAIDSPRQILGTESEREARLAKDIAAGGMQAASMPNPVLANQRASQAAYNAAILGAPAANIPAATGVGDVFAGLGGAVNAAVGQQNYDAALQNYRAYLEGQRQDTASQNSLLAALVNRQLPEQKTYSQSNPTTGGLPYIDPPG